MKKYMLLASVASATIALPANATPIIYTISGTFDGTLNGNPFSNTAATFTAVGDTKDLTTTADGSRNVALSSFSASSGGTTYKFSANSIRFGTNAGYAGIIFDVDGNNPFVFTGVPQNYDGVSNIANGAVNYYNSFGGPFASDQGAVTFSGATNLQFSAQLQASAVPEPATWAMMILGMGAVGFAMRRRQKVSTKVAFG